MRPRYIFAVLMMLACLTIWGQQSKTVSMQGQPKNTSTQVNTNQQETILKLQAKNEVMLNQLEKMEKEIELYRGDVRTKVAELDYAQDRWFNKLAIIIGLIGVVLGIIAPYFINNEFRKHFENRFSEMKTDLEYQVTTATEQASNHMQQQVKDVAKQVEAVTQQAMIAKDAVTDVEVLKKHVTEIEEKINRDKEAAENAAKAAKVSQLFSEALNEKDSSKAIELYNQVIEQKPDFIEAYNNRGILKRESGDLKGAMIDYNEAIKLNPAFFEAYNNRGRLKESMNDLTGAIADFNNAIKLSPNNAFAYFNRGSLKENMKNLAGALADYNRAIELNPDLAVAYINRGNIMDNMGDFAEAMADYNKAIELNPDSALAYNNRGLLFLKQGDPNRALNDLNYALKLDSNLLELYINFACCYRKLADSEQDTDKKTELIAKAEANEQKAESLRKEAKK